MVFDDCLQSVQIKDSPGIEDFNIKIEVSGLIFILDYSRISRESG